MVHRAPDSRLLTNLIQHEKEHAKHLAALFPLSHAALASLSAYAAASPSSQPTIAAVVDVLASADDALQRYAHAIDSWREQLVALKDLEDDLTAVLRDRDILVTRLIKASKSTRDAHRSSRLVAPLSNLGSASLSSLPSTNSSTTGFSTTGSSPASTNAKLAQAQAELQACEVHLVSKERELDARRITLARDGLGARCRALIDCGWVWGELGKQGLKALQALSADLGGSGSSVAAPKQSLAIPSRLSTNANPNTYASDSSSLTPSQSASQTAPRSVETSLEGPAPREYGRVQLERERSVVSKPEARSTHANKDDLTITLPPAHAISELALPTGVLSQHQPVENGDLNAITHLPSQPAAAPPRKRTKQNRRPPSQHIAEVSDEGSDEPPSASNRDANTAPRISHPPFPTVRASGTRESSSDDEPTGPLQVVENDPFEVIRRSILGPPSASPVLMATAPNAHASAPDVRLSVVDESSAPKLAFPGPVSLLGHGHGGIGVGLGLPSDITGTSPGKRQRRTSMAFFGSLRGLFRKPKERLVTQWDESSSPSPASPNRGTKTGGWVTRTDARLKGRSREDSDDESPKATKLTGNVPNVVTIGRARLRKGRPSASARENGPSRVPSHRGVDGWITDTPVGAASGSRTRRGMMNRKRTSVADLRGSDQGHTDGELDGGRRRLEPVSKPIVEVKEERQLAAPREAEMVVALNAKPTAEPDANAGTQQRRATATATSSRQLSSSAPRVHRRSASLSLVDAHMTIMSTSTTSLTSSQNMSWRKPPPPIEPVLHSASSLSSPPQSNPQSPSQSQAELQARESPPKQNAKRHLGNGHAKHVQNQSLMSIVADVTRQNGNLNPDVDRTRSLDIPRAPGSVLRQRDREVEDEERWGHARTASSPEDGGRVNSGQGKSQRAIKMPLKSALRNPSRTPSPSPGPSSVIVPMKEVRKEAVDEGSGRVVSPPWRDSASISSYETGRESLYGEEVERASLPSPPRSPLVHSLQQFSTARSQSLDLISRSQTPSPPPPFTFPPPPVDPPPVRRGATPPTVSANEPPSSNASAETPAVQRRKSVRVSLQPTFSPTPPASRDEDDESAPWSEEERSSGRKERGRDGGKTGRGHGDVWADSSEEDEAYSHARRLLSLVGRGKS